MREELVQELVNRADLTEDQARRAVDVLESFLRERGITAETEGFQGLFTGATRLFEGKE